MENIIIIKKKDILYIIIKKNIYMYTGANKLLFLSFKI